VDLFLVVSKKFSLLLVDEKDLYFQTLSVKELCLRD
jgi:hypothetical protein